MKGTIVLGSDHAGYELKEYLRKYLLEESYEVEDKGTYSAESTDYPDYAHAVAQAVELNHGKRGILLCGSANGVCITANKHKGVRAALCWNPEVSRLARAHNDANILCIPARFIEPSTALEILQAFLETPFEGGRHQKRVDKISGNQ